MDVRRVISVLKTPVTLVLLVLMVLFAARWAYDAVTAPIPKRPAEPCVVKEIGPTLKPEHVYVRVLNGTETGGLAKRLGAVLSADGFKVQRRVNADRTDYEKSLVVGHSEDSPEVVLVRLAFKDIAFQADGRVDHTVDIIIGKVQPVLAEPPPTGVPLPTGKACLPQLEITVTE